MEAASGESFESCVVQNGDEKVIVHNIKCTSVYCAPRAEPKAMALYNLPDVLPIKAICKLTAIGGVMEWPGAAWSGLLCRGTRSAAKCRDSLWLGLLGGNTTYLPTH